MTMVRIQSVTPPVANSVTRRAPLLLTVLLAAAAALLLLLSSPAPGHAQTTGRLLLGNTGNTSGGINVGAPDTTQPFKTGKNPTGYTLTRIQLGANILIGTDTAPSASEMTVTLRADSSGDPADTALATFSFPDTWTPSALNEFTLATAYDLDPDTPYHIHIAATKRVHVFRSAASQVDGGSASDWSFSTHSYLDADDGWTASTDALAMELHGTIKATAPGAPTGLTVTDGHHAVKLDWTAPADNGGSPITGYEYTVNDSATFVATGSTGTSHILDNLAVGTYSFLVRAVNAAGEGDLSSAVTFYLVPASVQIIGAGARTEGDDAKFTLVASRPVLSSSKPLNVSVLVSESEDMVASAEEGAKTVSFALDETTAVLLVPTVDDGVAESNSVVTMAIQTDADYTLGVISSATVTVIDAETLPGAPTGLTFTEGHRVVELEWTAPANDGGSPITRYEGRLRWPDGDDFLVPLGDSTSYTLSLLLSLGDRVFTVEVRAVNAAESGRWSPPVTITMSPATVTIAGGGGVVEGTDAAFTLTASKPVLSADRPLNVSVLVSESGDQVASADEGTQTVSFALNGSTAVALSVPTVGDTVYQGASVVTAAIRSDPDYTVGPASSGTVRVADDEPRPVSAGSVLLNSTTEQAKSHSTSLGHLRVFQDFKTGVHPGGYELHRIKVEGASTRSVFPSGITATIRIGGQPWSPVVATLGNPSSWTTGMNEFIAPDNTILSPSTNYVLHFSHSATGDDRPTVSAGVNGNYCVDNHAPNYNCYAGPDAWNHAHHPSRGIETLDAENPWGLTDDVLRFSIEGLPAGRSGQEPSPPENLSAQPCERKYVNLSWAAPFGSPDRYEIRASGIGSLLWDSHNVNTQVISTTATEYRHTVRGGGTYYTVRAINANGPGPWSAIQNGNIWEDGGGRSCGPQNLQKATPAAPGKLVAEASGAMQVDLLWTVPYGGPTGYQVQWSADGETGWTAVSPPHRKTSTHYSHTGRTGLTTYHYRVRAMYGDGAGPWSVTAAATTPDYGPWTEDLTRGREPHSLLAWATDAGIRVCWFAPEDAAHQVTGYRVLRRLPETGGSFAPHGQDRGSTATSDIGQCWTDSEVEEGVLYTYRVKAIRNHRELSRWSRFASARATVTPDTGAPANTPATGLPAISGTAQVGETLTADTSGIADADGLDSVTFAYRWQSDSADISGATDSTYTPVVDDVGKAVSVTVTFTDDTGNEEELTSAATDAVEPETREAQAANTPATGLPAITGIVRVGEKLTADLSGIADEDGLDDVSYSYQWQADGADIPGETLNCYTPDDADEGKTISVRVTFTDDAGNGESLTSAATDAVEARPNRPATGALTITGTARVGELLTADVSNIMDDDGLDRAAFAYQWQADGTDLSGATGSSYTLAASDEGKAISVTVSFTDYAGHEESLTSTATAAVAAAAEEDEEPTDRPHGLTAEASDGAVVLTWTAPVVDYKVSSYHILRHRPEQGEAEPLVYVDQTPNKDTSYTDTEVEPGVLYVYRVKAIVNWMGDLGEASDAAQIRAPATAQEQTANVPATGAPTISGTVQVGEKLTADTSGIADDDGLADAVFSHQWQADGADISDATSDTYTLAEADEGKAVSVKVSFTDDAGNDETLTSAATAAAEAKPNTPATGQPTISGTAQVGETLTADTSGIADDDGLSNSVFSYQWQADGAEISSATSDTYTLADADEGKAMSVTVSFTDDRGHGEELSSAATAAVEAKANSPATGAPAVTGTAQVGETLSTDTSGIADADGLTNASFDYQWLADGAEISSATSDTYTLADADEGKAISVTVSFTDDGGNEESLTSAATDAVDGAPSTPLTVSVENAAASHDGESVFTFELRFSEEFGISYKTLRDHAFTVTGGTVKKAQRIEQGSNIGWKITVRPNSDGAVTIILPITEDCDAQGAICTEDGRMLSNELVLTVSGP